MRITRTQAEALATAASRIRPDWHHTGILRAIEAAAPIAAPADLAVALFRLASNLDMRTPALLAQPGPHWAATVVAERRPPTMCGDHPTRRAITCPDCAAELAHVNHEARAAEMRAAIRDLSAERRRLKQGAP